MFFNFEKYISIKTQIIHNSQFVLLEQGMSYMQNRAFLYGDSIFETLRVNNRQILFFDEHLQRLVSGMEVLKYIIPDIFTIKKSFLYEQIIQLLNKNKIFKSSKIRITVFRKDGGLYTPDINEVNFVISATQIKDSCFVLNNRGLHIGIFEDVRKPINIFSKYKTANSLIFTLAGVYKKEKKYDDCLILNENNNIAEAISSNIFYVKNNKLFYPPLADGCIDGIMKKQIIKIANSNNIICVERSLQKKDLLILDEVFLTNAVSGIRWVGAYKNKRYFKNMSSFLITQLNK